MIEVNKYLLSLLLQRALTISLPLPTLLLITILLAIVSPITSHAEGLIEPETLDGGVVIEPDILRTAPNSSGMFSQELWSIHGQFTNVTQGHPSFKAPYSGAYSLNSTSDNQHTNDATLYIGARLWQGGEFYINPEIDEGFGFNNTLGAAGFPNGEAYKVGKNHPYLRWHRIFIRQVISLGEEEQTVEAGANQLAGSKAAENITFTIGKFSAVEIFDTNAYAHDPRADFLNWSILDAGAFDYAADAWGYSIGLAAEWTQSWWTLRGGLFNLSKIPNSDELEKHFSQYAFIGELEERHQWLGRPGKLKVLGFVNRGRMANYDDAVHLAQQSNSIPDVGLVRHFSSRPGMAINLEQELSTDLGMFMRVSMNDGSKEAFEFTDINKSLSAGLSLHGNAWGRPDDTLGIAGVVNGLSGAARDYFSAGGLGILVGDGQLPHYSTERILETFYSLKLNKLCRVGLDYQYIANPAYNSDRGPVSIFGFRGHFEF